MKLEKIKSVILTILIGISFVLTYIQWTYQPSLDFLGESDVLISPVSINEKRLVEEVFLPTKLIIHRSGMSYGSEDMNDIIEVFDNIKKWKFLEVKDITTTITNDQFSTLVHGDGKIELIFEDYVPLNFYNKVLSFSEDQMPPVNFDRIVIDMNNFEENQVPVYFVSYHENQENKRKVYETRASGNMIKQIQTKYYQIPQRFTVYNYYDNEEFGRIYYPRNLNNEVQMYSYKFSPYDADTELYKDALFSNPNFVTKRFVDGGEEYNDSFSLMSVDYSSKTLSFVNPAIETSTYIKAPEVLQNSFDFINEHAGWTDMYIYDNWDRFDNKVSFRLYHKGFPVYYEKGQDTIEVKWGKEDIYQYKRPYFQLKFEYKISEFNLPPGDVVIEQLAEQFDLKDLQALTIGYKIVQDNQSTVISLEPSWYYLHAGNWLSITFNEQGGDNHGLE